jgi:hypothetical protein
MRSAGKAGRGGSRPMAIVLGLGILGWACAPTVARRQTDVMEKSGKVSISAAELRARVDILANHFADQLEQTADRIHAETPDRVVRRRALAFKVDAVPAIYTAAYHVDPMMAVVDVWAFSFQLRQYLDEGPGREAFGPCQGIAREDALALLAEADRLVEGIVSRPQEFGRERAKVEAWAAAHPVRYTFSSRPSMVDFAARLRSEDRDAFVAVGEATETIESLSERLNTYVAQMPKVARWQAELLLVDQAGEHDVVSFLDDVNALGTAARRADALLADVPGLVSSTGSPLREAVAAERAALLRGVNDQRLSTIEYVTAERLAVAATLREERMATVAFMHQERLEALKEIDAIRTRTVATSVEGLRDLIDYTLWRVGVFLVVLAVTMPVTAVVVYRLTAGRRAGGPPTIQ